jgi:hypothetical protein
MRKNSDLKGRPGFRASGLASTTLSAVRVLTWASVVGAEGLEPPTFAL